MIQKYIHTISHLLYRDLRIFNQTFWDKFINTCIMMATMLIVFSYFLPAQGLSTGYGPFILVGTIAQFGFFDIMGKVTQLVIDMESDKTIAYTLSLPLPAWLVFFQIGLSWSLHSLIVCAILLPLGKLFLFFQFIISTIDYGKFLLISIISNLFFGFFALWIASVIKNIASLGNLFVRIINPMYMFGCFMYSWKTAYNMSPILGYISLCNPLVYVMEGMRAAILGQNGSLPFWNSAGIICICTIVFGWDAIRRLLKRLDCA